jgi:cold shock CspA family protein
MSTKDNSDTSTQDLTTTTTTTTKFFGRVKWFNNKAGYGFVTVLGEKDTEHLGEDIFAHHSGVNVGSEQYKYLVQGEYVTFELRSSDSGNHPYQANKLTGLFGGNLMCETRNEQRQLRSERGEDGDDDYQQNRGRHHDTRHRGGGRRDTRPHGGGPRDGKWSVNGQRQSGRQNTRNESTNDC